MSKIAKIKPESGRHHSNTIAKPPIFKRLCGLWLVTASLGMLFMLIDQQWGLSLLWGSSVCLLPVLCFSWFVYKYQGARQASATVIAFYSAESLKFILTALLFAAVFHRADKINLAVFFLAFITAQIFSWLLIAFTLKQQSK